MPHKPAELAANTREMVAALVSCGIDPDKSILFNQAQVPAHAEMQWLLNGTARMGWLNRMTQWKDKAGKNREGASEALGGGGMASLRVDPMAKGYAQMLLDFPVFVPEAWLQRHALG